MVLFTALIEKHAKVDSAAGILTSEKQPLSVLPNLFSISTQSTTWPFQLPSTPPSLCSETKFPLPNTPAELTTLSRSYTFGIAPLSYLSPT